jgi:acetylornithine deacetylase
MIEGSRTLGTTTDFAKEAVLGAVDEQEILKLEQGAVRIPSLTFEEHGACDYFARQMEALGLEVEVFTIADPYGAPKSSRQPVGRLRSSGGGPSLMFQGHMDHVPLVGEWDRDPFSGDFEDGWIHGRGCQDDKGGIVSAIGAVAALKRAGVELAGDILVCPVMGHKSGAIGAKDLVARGILADYAINTENSGNGLATVTTGVIKARLHSRAEGIHIMQSRQPVAFNRFDQLARLILALGPSWRKIPSGGWLTYEECAELPDFPQFHLDELEGPLFEPQATVEIQVRTVPGMTKEMLRADLERVVAELRRDDPTLDIEIEIPPKGGQYAGWDWPPANIDHGDPLVVAMIDAHTRVTGDAPEVGAGPRLGAVGDASFLQEAGIKTVLYGPGTSSIFTQWPTPNERVSLEELVVAAKVYALAAIDICGVADMSTVGDEEVR